MVSAPAQPLVHSALCQLDSVGRLITATDPFMLQVRYVAVPPPFSQMNTQCRIVFLLQEALQALVMLSVGILWNSQ